MYFVEILSRLPISENSASLLAALVITGVFGIHYKRLAAEQRRQEMLRDFPEDLPAT